jgi:CRISPR-associated protein Cas1
MLSIMHSGPRWHPAFVFDLMEPERPRVNCAVLEFLKSEVLHSADFTIREGVVGLNSQLARHVVNTLPAVFSG